MKIPSEIYQLDTLEQLLIGTNYKLSGTIHSTIGTMSNLTYFDARSTNLMGSVPIETANLLPKLEDFYICKFSVRSYSATCVCVCARLRLCFWICQSHFPLLALRGQPPILVNTSITGDLTGIFCNSPNFYRQFNARADCGGTNPEVTCGCCKGCHIDE